MFHSSAWVIAGTAVSVAATAAGTAMSASAADKAAKAQGRAGAMTKKELKKLQQQISAIPAPKWDIARDIKDAGQITDYNIQQLEEIFPGARTQREIASRATESLLRGEIPKDVQDQIMRSVAELGGAGFAPTEVPSPSGFQAAEGLLGRQIGKMSVELSQLGNQMSQRWIQLMAPFIESPLQVGQSRLGYEKAAADIELAKLGMAQENVMGRYGIETQTIGSRLAASQALASGITTTGQALGSGLSSYGMASAMASPSVTYGGQQYGAVKGFEGQNYVPQVTSSGGLYYTRERASAPSASATKALTGAYG